MTVLLTLMASALGSRVGFVLDLVDRLEEQQRALEAAEGVVDLARALVAQDPTPGYDSPVEGWIRLGAWQTLRTPEVEVDLGGGLVDEDRKLNLNSAPVEVLARFFQKQGLGQEEGRKMAEAVVDWRDKDDHELPDGAEGFYYRGLEDAYDAKNGPFESLEEILLVRGMTPELWQTCSRFLTVYGSGSVNLNGVPKEVLVALGLSVRGVQGFLAYRSGEDGQDGTADDETFFSVNVALEELRTHVPAEDLALLSRLRDDGLVGVASKVFSLSVTAKASGSKAPVHIGSVLDREGQILAWRES